jgi:phosphatidylglycerol:prolipoprotein diacylglycerol transferase
MHPFWMMIGSWPLRAYSTVFLFAFAAGVGVSAALARLRGEREWARHIVDLAPFLFLAGVFGARLWQVAFFDWPYYSRHLSEVVAIWHGGLSIQGGVVFSLVAAAGYARKHRISLGHLADLCAPGLLIGQSLGRAANLLNGDAFGAPTGYAWGILYPVGSLARTIYGDRPLWPAEVWEGQADIALFAIIVVLGLRPWPRGSLFACTVAGYSAVRFLLETLRGDSPRYLFGWDAAQWTCIVAMLLCAIWLPWIRVRSKRGVAARLPANAP